MNAFRIASSVTKRGQAMVARRAFSSKGPIPTSSSVSVDGTKVVGLNHLSTGSMRWAERQKHWLSDPACYPLIAILGATSVFVAGFMGYFTLTAPDVQISPLKRNSTMRNWQ